MNNIIMPASNILISEARSNRRYMSLSMRMFSTRENLNHVAVTEAFIDEIVANKEEYVCMPLCADVSKMKAKDYRGLTHLYDQKTGVFLADVIGGFYDFEKVSDEYGVSLIGHARVNKRVAAVCAAIEELYAKGELSFSFEISAGQLRMEDGITIVDASAENELTAMAVVSVPAYPESKALDLVAEAKPSVEEFFENVRFLSAELDIETVRMRFFHTLDALIGEESWHMRPLLFCVDCAILYDVVCGKSFKVEYMTDGDTLMIKDFYEIEYVRAEEGSETEMNKDEKIFETEQALASEAEVAAEAVEEVTVAEPQQAEAEETAVSEEVASEEATEPEKDAANVEAEACTDEASDDNAENNADELEAMRKECAEMKAQIEQLLKVKAELDKIKAEQEAAEAEAKKSELRQFAIAEGLDVEAESIARAIDEMDHASLVAEVMKTKNAKKESDGNVAFVASFDVKQKGTSYLLGHSK